MRGDWSNGSISPLSYIGIMFSLLYLSSFHIALIPPIQASRWWHSLCSHYFFSFVLVDQWMYMSSWKPWIGHYDTLRKKVYITGSCFLLWVYGIMFPFIIFIIHMILLLSYFGSLSGSYFVWKSTFIFLFFNFEFMYLLIVLDMDSLS